MTDEHIIAYLLEDLSEKELEQFEDECFAQESWPNQINLVEEDLIDAYLRDELTPEQRQRFERNYLTTESRQERVIMAAALLRHVDEQNKQQAHAQATITAAQTEHTWGERFRAFWSKQNRVLRYGTASAAVLIIAGVLWLSLSRAPTPKTFANLTLTSSISNRSEGARADKVKLPLPADALKISLTLPERLPPEVSYRVELENENGVTKPLEIAGQDARFVSVVIPAAQLERGQYALSLSFIKPDGTELPFSNNYFFNVE